MPGFPRRSILTTRTASISSRSRGSRRGRVMAHARNAMTTRLNERGTRTELEADHEWNEFYCSKRHQSLGGVDCYRRGGRGCRAVLGDINIGSNIEVNGGG